MSSRRCVSSTAVWPVLISILIAPTLVVAQDTPLPVDPHADLVDLFRLTYPLTGRTGQTSSYDRSGGNGDAIFWYYLRAEPRRVVMADLAGPGCVSRIWVTAFDWNTARIEVFIDGVSTPAVSAYMRDFFGTGALPPFVSPLAAPSTGSWVSYVPIPFRRSCRIEAIDARTDNNVIYYNVTYRQYLPGAPVAEVFQMPPTVAQQDDLDTLSQQWALRGEDPKPAQPGSQTSSGSTAVSPAQTATLASLSGSGVVTGIELNVTPSSADVFLTARLRARWDGSAEYAVDAPLGAFFGTSLAADVEPLPIGFKDGELYCFFPMPYNDGAIIELVNPTGTTLSPVDYTITYAPKSPAEIGRLRFHTQARAQVVTGGMPSYRILEIDGSGHYLGCVISIAPSITHWGVLEGDEQIYVNGEPTASILGTGTEDYFNGGFYFSGGPVSLPFGGCSVIDNINFRMSAYRLHVPDPVVFDDGIIVDMEHGGVNEASGDYRTTAFYYRDDAAGDPPADPAYPALPTGTLVNGDFESSFGGYNGGEADGWIAYQARDNYGESTSTFEPGTTIRHSGAAAQHVTVAPFSSGGPRSAGIAQQVQVTRDKYYEVTAHLRSNVSGGLFPDDLRARVGIGTGGSTYHAASDVVWVDAPTTTGTWHEVSVVAKATGDYLTVFAEGQRTTAKGFGTAEVWIDDVSFEPFTGEPPPPPLPPVVNPGFEQELNDFVWPMWRGPDSNDQQLERVWQQSGNPDGVWLLMVKGLGSTGKGAYQYIPTNWQPDREYRLNVRVRNLGPASIRYSIGYQLGHPGADGGVDAIYGPDVFGTTSWQTVSVEFTYTGTSGVTIYLRAVNAGSPEAAAFDLVTVEQLTFDPPEPPPFPGDFDDDDDVDQADYGLLQRCLSGDGIQQTDPTCAAADLDVDDDVDANDYVIFEGCVSGAGIPADPDCAG